MCIKLTSCCKHHYMISFFGFGSHPYSPLPIFFIYFYDKVYMVITQKISSTLCFGTRCCFYCCFHIDCMYHFHSSLTKVFLIDCKECLKECGLSCYCYKKSKNP